MPNTLLMFVLLLAMTRAGSPAPNEAARCDGSSVEVIVEGLKDKQGRLIAELYPATEADFLSEDDKLVKAGKVFRRTVTPIPSPGPGKICVKAPSPGRYALIVIHDRDGLDKFSIRKDGLALPVPRTLGASRPRLSQAIVSFGTYIPS